MGRRHHLEGDIANDQEVSPFAIDARSSVLHRTPICGIPPCALHLYPGIELLCLSAVTTMLPLCLTR